MSLTASGAAVVGAGPAVAHVPSASPGPMVGAGVLTLDATTELLGHDFSQVTEWGLMDTDRVRIEPNDVALRFRLDGSDFSNRCWRGLGETFPVVRVSVASTVESLPTLEAPTALPMGGLDDAVPAVFAGDRRSVPGDAALERFLDLAGGDRSATDRTAAPALTDDTIGGRAAGRLACYDAPRGGVTVQWTNQDLLALAFGTHASGPFADAFAWWQNAGPVP